MRGDRRYYGSALPVLAAVIVLLGIVAASGRGSSGRHGVPTAEASPTASASGSPSGGPSRSPSGGPSGSRSGGPSGGPAGAPTGDVAAPTPAGRPRLPSGVHPPAGATSPARDRMRSLLGECRTVGWSDCAGLGDHYLSATGTPFSISMPRLLSRVTSVRNGLRDALRSDAATALAAGGGDHAFDTGWRTYSATSGDWYYALHTFRARLVGDVWVGPGSGGSRLVQLRYRTFVYDVYDFPASGAFSEFRQLADQGFAAEFLVTGASRTVLDAATAGSLHPADLSLHW